MSNLALPKTGCTSAESKQGGLRRSPSVSAMPKRGDGLAWRSTYSGLWLCTRFALFFETRTQSRTAEQAERRIKRSLNYAEAKPALAAEQQQYALSFSLSALCILLTLTRRLRVISNAYFDTPSGAFQPLWWKTRQKYIRWKSFPIPTNGDMRRLKYLQMGIFNWFAKAVVDTGWSLRRAEAVSARIRVYRFGSGDKVVCLWFVELLSGRIKRQDGEAWEKGALEQREIGIT